MKRLRKFFQLPWRKQRLLLKASVLLVVIRVGLALFPFAIFKRLLTRASGTPVRVRTSDRAFSEQIVWAVETASRHIPGTQTCLTKALTAQVLLHRRGYPAQVTIGVRKGSTRQLRAHAWLESQGQVVMGASLHDQYTPLHVLREKEP
jgi:hypothetical protein